MISATFSIHQPLYSAREFGLVGLQDIKVVLGDMGPMLFTATRGDGWLSAYALGDQPGQSILMQQLYIGGHLLQLESTDLVLRDMGSSDQLYMAGLNGTNMVGVTLSSSSQPISGSVHAQASGYHLGSITEIEMLSGGQTGIAAMRDGGLVNISWGSGNRLNISEIYEGADQDGARATDIITATHNGQSYAFVSYGADDTVSMFRQGTGDRFNHVIDMTRDDGFWVDRPNDLAVATAADGRLYAVVAGSGSDSLTSFAVSPAGNGMFPVDHVIDTLETRFDKASHVTSVAVGGHSFILAAGADSGISVFTLLPGGRLQHVKSLEATADAPLRGISSLDAMATPDGIRIWASTQGAPYLSEFSIDFPQLGISRIASADGGRMIGTDKEDLLAGASGADSLDGGRGADILLDGAGADTLNGGHGADLFILSKDEDLDTITDFNPLFDQIDLTAFGVLTGAGNIEFNARNWGAELHLGDDVLRVFSSNGHSLSERDFTPENLVTGGRVETDPALLPGSKQAPRPDLNRGYTGNPDGTNPQELYPKWRDAPQVQMRAQADDVVGNNTADHMQTSWQNDRIRGAGGNDTLETGAGQDVADGQGGNDSLSGGADDDLLLGGGGFDTLDGGAGDDTLSGDTFADLLRGGDGNDVLIGGDGFDVLHGDNGADQIWAGASPDRIFGGEGDDWLSAGSNFGTSVDGVFGEGGNDTLFGNAGFDLLNGGEGDDVLDGGHQADNLYGEDGNDILLGNQGFDRLFGGDGNDRLYGGDSGDGLFGQAGDDTIWGGEGGDRFFGGQGNDIVDGGNGRDTIYADAGFDTIIGGADDDLMFGSFNADEFVFGNDHGNDTIGDFDATSDNEFINLKGLDGLTVFQDVLNASVQTGQDVLINTGANSSIRLVKVQLSDLDEKDFTF